jgi:hypothetical protein
MTLIVSLFSDNSIIQLSDRRITLPDGAVIEDEYNKAIMVRTQDTSSVMGFTGIAKTSNFSTTDWVSETLQSCAKPDYKLVKILNRFCEKATAYFKNSKELMSISNEEKSLFIGFSGYLLTDPVTPFFAQVANFKNPNDPMEFQSCFLSPGLSIDGSLGAVALLGQSQIISDKELEPVIKMLKEETPFEATINKMVELFNSAMSKGKGGLTIGPQVSSVTIIKEEPGGFKVGYHTGIPKTEIAAPKWLHLTLQDTSEKEFKFLPTGPENKIKNVPIVARNARCPCGSEKKYKHCHGRYITQKIAHRQKLERKI